MRLSFRQLKGCSVETKSGIHLGKLKDVILEIDGQIIAQYIVSPHLWPGKELLISRDQIISIDDKKIIADDGVGTLLDDEQKNTQISPSYGSARKIHSSNTLLFRHF